MLKTVVKYLAIPCVAVMSVSLYAAPNVMTCPQSFTCTPLAPNYESCDPTAPGYPSGGWKSFIAGYDGGGAPISGSGLQFMEAVLGLKNSSIPGIICYYYNAVASNIGLVIWGADYSPVIQKNNNYWGDQGAGTYSCMPGGVAGPSQATLCPFTKGTGQTPPPPTNTIKKEPPKTINTIKKEPPKTINTIKKEPPKTIKNDPATQSKTE